MATYLVIQELSSVWGLSSLTWPNFMKTKEYLFSKNPIKDIWELK